MTRIIVALVSIALVFTVACGGDKKDGGILGGGGSSSGGANTNTKDPVAFAQAALTTTYNVFGGSADPQKLLDLYLPECRTGVKTSDITQVLGLIKAFFPDINKLKVEDIDLANPKVEKNGTEYKLTITDINKVRIKANGKFVNAIEYMKSIGFTDPDDSPLEGLDEPLLLKEQDGRLYISECDDLQDLTSASSGPTPTPTRTAATATPQRAGATATPARATVTIGRDITTPTRGNTPTSAQATAVPTLVRSTPTAAQRYPAALEKEFMDDCTGTGASQSVCRCMLDLLATRYDVAGYRALERAIEQNQRQGELNAIVSACTR